MGVSNIPAPHPWMINGSIKIDWSASEVNRKYIVLWKTSKRKKPASHMNCNGRFFITSRAAMVPAGVEHYFQHRYPANYVRTIYFFSEPEDSEDPFYNKTGIYPVSNLLLEMILHTAAWDGDILPDDKRFVFIKAIKYMLPAISSVPLPITLPTTDNPRLQPVLRYIQENLGEQLTLETVGHAFSYSERTLTRLFRATMDISFFQYLKLARMIKAMGYLLETEKTISEIAWDTGYNSVSAFSNTFYKLVGKRPSDFQP